MSEYRSRRQGLDAIKNSNSSTNPQKPGWYNVPGKGDRYWTGSEYRFYGPSEEGDGRNRIEILGWLGDKFQRSQQPLSPERQALSEAQQRFNDGDATEADLVLLREGKSDKEQKPAAPPQADEKPEGVPGQLPPSAAIPGTGPKGNEVGSDADPDTPGLQGPGGTGGSGGSDTRVSPTGVFQRGITLGGINELFASLSSADRKGGAVMTAGELPSGSKFLSEALPTTEGGEEQAAKPFTLSQVDLDEGYDSSDGAYPGKATAFNQTPTTPETTSNPSNDQDGASDKPDIADNIRTIRMGRGAGAALGGAAKPNDSEGDSKNSGTNWGARTMADNSSERLKARAAFLDPNNKGYGAIRARDRAVGAFDQNGVGGVNIDGKVYNFKDGMSRDARFELAGGLSSKDQAQEFLNKYVQTVQEAPKPAEVPTDTAAVTPVPEAPASEQTDTTIGTPGKPQTVPMSQIPGPNSTPEEQQAYLKRLDAGELTGPATYRK